MLKDNEIEENKQKFLKLCRENIKRDGIDKLLDFLENKSDFFIAPSSSKFHSNFKGGLCKHSLNVFEMLMRDMGNTKNYTRENLVICSLFHDLCKVNFYKEDTRNQKNKDGKWESVPYFTIDDKLCMGHGEGSVYIINNFMHLTMDEALAISWHMGGFDTRVKGGSFTLSSVFSKCELALELHIADMRATYILENETRG